MELDQAISLIHHTIFGDTKKSVWTDLGCGRGLFTNALAHQLAHGSKIIAVDKDASALKQLHLSSSIILQKMQLDFVKDVLPLQDLDGILMANSLHFVKEKVLFIRKIESFLRSNGTFVIVEYDTDAANQWVPFPISFTVLAELFQELGYKRINRIGTLPSRFGGRMIYSAIITRT